MMHHAVRPILVCSVLLLALAGLTACAGGQKPVVRDFDTYSLVEIGKLAYATPAGVKAVRQEPNYVLHDITTFPGCSMFIRLNEDPPRGFKRESENERRRFLGIINGSRMTSVQHLTAPNFNEGIKIQASGVSKTGEPAYGTLAVLRKDGKTAVIGIKGPVKFRPEMARLMEDIISKIDFHGSFRTVQSEIAPAK